MYAVVGVIDGMIMEHGLMAAQVCELAVSQ